MGITMVTHGGSQAYTFAPQTGYLINQVLIDGINNATAVTSGKYTFSNVTAPHTIVVSFVQKGYDITATTGANGTVAPLGVTTVLHGNSMTYLIVPDPLFVIKQVLVDGKNVAASVSSGMYTFVNVTAKHTISATFSPVSSATISDEGNVISVYPNPTDGILYVAIVETDNYPSLPPQMTNIQLFDMVGKKITEVKPEGLTYKMDISDLATGVYFIRIETSSETVTRKVVKQ
jgi:hypothetical protein